MSAEQNPTTQSGDITQEATTPTPTTKPAKNPKRVEAGKVAALPEAEEKLRKVKAKAKPAPAPVKESPPPASSEPGGLSMNQWLIVGSILVSLVGLYYKREELQAVLKTRAAEPSAPQPSPAPPGDIPRPRRGCHQME